MRKIILLAFLLTITFAEPLVAGKAYIVSSINKNASESISAGESFSLVPQIIVANGNENYVGSVTPFTGCYGGKRYEKGSETGNCLTGVVNSLNSDSETDALSAAQGKILNEKINNAITKNYFNPVLLSGVYNGFNVTANKNGTYTVSGTNSDTSDKYINLAYGCALQPGTYKFVGTPSSGDYNIYFLYIDGDVQYHDFYGNGVVFTTNKEVQYAINILVRPGITLNNVIFKPMITKNLEATYDDYVSYQETFDGSDLLYNNGPQLDASYDMNNLTKPGVYRQGGTSLPANSPGAPNASIVVMVRSGGAGYGVAGTCDIVFQY